MPQGRKPNDGRGRLGGRQEGTPNKDKPLKTILHDHSMVYFEKNIPAEEAFKNYKEEDRNKLRELHAGRIFSQFEIDLMVMKPSDRVNAELNLLAYHTPKMQAVAATIEDTGKSVSFIDRLVRYAAGEELPHPA